MTARRPSRGGGLGIEARAEVARCAAKAWTAQYSTAQSMVGGTTATTVGDLELRVSEQPAQVLDDRHVVCPVGGLAPLCMTSTVKLLGTYSRDVRRARAVRSTEIK